jgi:hypothetical protein
MKAQLDVLGSGLMSRSLRRHPIIGMTTATSEKEDKQLAHRRHRRRVNEVLGQAPETPVLPHRRETSDPWNMAKDGKQRFDPRRFPELLRK